MRDTVALDELHSYIRLLKRLLESETVDPVVIRATAEKLAAVAERLDSDAGG